jgi:hypothetical protein
LKPVVHFSLLFPAGGSAKSEVLGRLYTAQVNLLLREKTEKYDIGADVEGIWARK